jgi:hypothetical protein
MKPALRVLGGVILLSGLVAGSALVYLQVLGPEGSGLDARLVEAQAELEKREAALKSCTDSCEDEERAVSKQRALVDVIQQEI